MNNVFEALIVIVGTWWLFIMSYIGIIFYKNKSQNHD